MPLLIGPGLISCALNVSEAEETEDPEDPSNIAQEGKEKSQEGGVVAFNKTLAPGLVKALTDEEQRPKGLRVLNSTLFTLTLVQMKKVLEMHKGLMVLIVTVEVDEVEETRKKLIQCLELCEKVEQVEIVANPSLQFFMAVSVTSSDWYGLG